MPKQAAGTRWLRFSLFSMFAAVTIFCICLAVWHFLHAAEQRRSLCEQITNDFLLFKHVKFTSEEKRSDFLRNRVLQPSGSSTYILRPDGTFSDGAVADDFEKHLLAKWSGTTGSGSGPPHESESAERHLIGGGAYTYYKAVRANIGCSHCHAANEIGEFSPGGLMSIIKLELQ